MEEQINQIQEGRSSEHTNGKKITTSTNRESRDAVRQSYRHYQNGKNSTHSSYSKLGTPLKGESLPQSSSIRGSEVISIYRLAQKYLANDTAPERIREEMQLALERKNSQIQALRVQRDELKFISYNAKYDAPIKMGLALLKEKAKTEEKMRDTLLAMRNKTREIEVELGWMTDYHHYLIKAIKARGEQDLMIDPQEEEKLMLDNLQKETSYLLRELKEEDKKNARQIRTMQEQIANFRVMIKQKEDRISHLKSRICTLHIKLHNRVGSTSRHKNISLSIRKFNTDNNTSIQQAFIGNGSFKHYSKQLLEKISSTQELTKILFYFDSKKQMLNFRCIYNDSQGIMHFSSEQPSVSTTAAKSNKDEENMTELIVKELLSIKFYFKSKIVGLQCRLKSQKRTYRAHVDAVTQLQHQLLTLINKRVVTLGSYWYQKDMIGVGVWYCSRLSTASSNRESKPDLRNVKSAKKPNKNEVISQYYMP